MNSQKKVARIDFLIYFLLGCSFMEKVFSEDTCADVLDNCETTTCNFKVYRRKCQLTCNDCRSQAPVNCHVTKYGCCWDNVTISQSLNGNGCPACEDQHFLCFLYKRMCDKPHIISICPETCGVSCKKCVDRQERVCPYFKQYGYCEEAVKMMKERCAKTCGFC